MSRTRREYQTPATGIRVIRNEGWRSFFRGVGVSSRQKKCRDKMDQFNAEGKTVVFVSHALKAVKELCQRLMLLNEGRIITMGNTEKVINDYLAMLQQK